MIRSRLSKTRGFTLIELMIVVVIIGLLAAMAIPRFMSASVKSKQGEAKLFLKQIATFQMTYRVDSPTNSYYTTGAVASAANPDAFEDLDVTLPVNCRYEFTIVADGSDYIATATANLDDDGTEDIWHIGPDGHITCESDDSIE